MNDLTLVVVTGLPARRTQIGECAGVLAFEDLAGWIVVFQVSSQLSVFLDRTNTERCHDLAFAEANGRFGFGILGQEKGNSIHTIGGRLRNPSAQFVVRIVISRHFQFQCWIVNIKFRHIVKPRFVLLLVFALVRALRKIV